MIANISNNNISADNKFFRESNINYAELTEKVLPTIVTIKANHAEGFNLGSGFFVGDKGDIIMLLKMLRNLLLLHMRKSRFML